MKRSAKAHWQGGLKDGKGTLTADSGVLSETPYGFNTRFGDVKGTNPEELIGAAHAGCFSMALSNELGQAGISGPTIDTKADVTLDPGSASITSVHLTVRVAASGADKAAVEKAAAGAKANCPVSKVLNAEITMDLTVEV
ncbi:OsmC family peroxiredoxin [Lutibaculum baratangense]|uniref:Osmotically inducible protein C n=1 Tax=Lutibaculum baratangense AMV1 TaxID=631454 RepID=V4RHC0_9HYPH|nr:OsmC family peroxiredoxin [Lutibaculum baratangense]ESR25516.1 Osmotically inducible protein C [Lutibaculum baratangense AMV1]